MDLYRAKFHMALGQKEKDLWTSAACGNIPPQVWREIEEITRPEPKKLPLKPLAGRSFGCQRPHGEDFFLSKEHIY